MISRIFISIPSVNTLENKASRHKQRSEQPSLMPNLEVINDQFLERARADNMMSSKNTRTPMKDPTKEPDARSQKEL